MITFQEIVNMGLYNSIEIEFDDVTEPTYSMLRGQEFCADIYCKDCKRVSVFNDERIIGTGADNLIINGAIFGSKNREIPSETFSIKMRCGRNKNHKFIMFFLYYDNKIIKVGQFPSIADISNPELSQFNSVIDANYIKELKTASGLFSHGVGIGSFVYLRRIFEAILRKHHKAMEDSGNSVKGFSGMKVDEKIKSLSKSLPTFLVKNRAMYGILSKGIHELSEKECLENFDIVYRATLLILKKDEERRQQEAEEKELGTAIGRAKSQMFKDKTQKVNRHLKGCRDAEAPVPAKPKQ